MHGSAMGKNHVVVYRHRAAKNFLSSSLSVSLVLSYSNGGRRHNACVNGPLDVHFALSLSHSHTLYVIIITITPIYTLFGH